MDLQSLLSKLITFRTLSDDYLEINGLFDWIKEQLVDVPVHVVDFESGRQPSLLITTHPTKTPKLWLSAHVDIVPGSDDVFRPRVVDGKLYGRGALDMKYAVACFIKLLQELGTALHNYDFGIMLTSDEEIGSEHGVKALLEAGYRSEVCFLPDGGVNWQLERGAKGYWQVRVTSKGTSAHGSTPWAGTNAIDQLAAYLAEARKAFPIEPCGDVNHEHITLNIGRISGGAAVNQIPDYAEAELDIRFMTETERKQLETELTSLTTRFSGIELETVDLGNPSAISPENSYLLAYKACAQAHGVPIRIGLSHGASDGRYFTEYGIPPIIIYPTGGGHHSESEWIELASLDTFYAILKDFVAQMARKDENKKASLS